MEISKKTQEKNSILALALSEAIEKTVYDRTVRKRLAEIGSKFFEARNEPWLSEKKTFFKMGSTTPKLHGGRLVKSCVIRIKP